MEGSRGNMSPYRPFLLAPEERGVSNEGTQSVNEAPHLRDVKIEQGTYLEYPAKIVELRILKPYAAALRSALGDTVHVLQFRTPFSLNSVPNEWKRRTFQGLLWAVQIPGAERAYTTNSDLGTFYFKSKNDADQFVGKMSGGDPGPELDELLEQRENLRKLLGK